MTYQRSAVRGCEPEQGRLNAGVPHGAADEESSNHAVEYSDHGQAAERDLRRGHVPHAVADPGGPSHGLPQLVPDLAEITRRGLGRTEARGLDVKHGITLGQPPCDVMAAGAVFSEPVIAEVNQGYAIRGRPACARIDARVRRHAPPRSRFPFFGAWPLRAHKPHTSRGQPAASSAGACRQFDPAPRFFARRSPKPRPARWVFVLRPEWRNPHPPAPESRRLRWPQPDSRNSRPPESRWGNPRFRSAGTTGRPPPSTWQSAGAGEAPESGRCPRCAGRGLDRGGRRPCSLRRLKPRATRHRRAGSK